LIRADSATLDQIDPDEPEIGMALNFSPKNLAEYLTDLSGDKAGIALSRAF